MKRILITALLFLPIFSFGQVNLKNGLVACYPFNGSAVDATGNGNDGTVNGATLATDRFGKVNSAYKFDGNSYISVSPDQLKNKSYTYATWVKLDGIPAEGDQNSFITIGGVGADQGLVVASNYSNVSSNGFDVFGYNVGNPPVSGNWSAIKPDIGRWYHVVATRDNVSIKLYVDGILIANNYAGTGTNGTDPAYANTSYAIIGSRVGANGFIQSMQGSLDDIYLYNRAISAEEVKSLYQTTKSPSSVDLKKGLVACYPFNANANDESGNGNNGTLNGAVLTADRFGKANAAYNFDGNSYIALPSDKFAFQNYSYSAWIYVSSLPANGDTYRALSIGGACGDQNIDISNNYFGNTGFDGGGYDINTGSATVSGGAVGTLPTIGKWYHVVTTRDDNNVKLFVDGILINTYTTSGKLPYYGCSGQTLANIGTRSNVVQFFTGKMDDVYLYNRAISAEEVTALYQTTKSPQTVDLKNGLVACYPFNGSAVDATGNGNDSTVNGATLTADRFGKVNSAYNFDGNSYISVSPDQFKNQSYTYATWVKLDNLPTGGDNNCFITIGGAGGDQVLSVTSNYQAQISNGFNVGGYNNDNPIQSNNWTNVTPTVGKWYHVVCTRDNNSIKLYVDGALIDNNSTLTATVGTSPNYGFPPYVTFGARNGGASQYMQGSLDDIYLYNRAITPEEVTALYQETTKLSPCEGGVIACHPFAVVKTK